MSEFEIKITVKNKDLKTLMNALENQYSVKIGVINNSAGRTSDLKNAQIGKQHEFGEVTVINGNAVKLPERSWLRVPITEHLYKYLSDSGVFSKGFAKKIVDSRSLKPLMGAIALTSETVVMDAFDSGGFGKWQPSNMKYKKNHQTLVETQQLRNSVSTEIIKG